MYVITDNNNMIVYIAKNYIKQEEGILVDDGFDTKCIICIANLVINEVETIPNDVEATKYKYTKEEGFIINSDYKPVLTVEEQVTSLKAQIDILNVAMVL